MQNAKLFALSPSGEILDTLDVGGSRYWGKAFCCNVDDDPYLELVVSGSGGLDVIETRGFGPNTEHFQRRRDYRRLSVLPWAYEDTYFIYRGKKKGLRNRTDDLMLEQTDGRFRESGTFLTELLTLPPGGFFTTSTDNWLTRVWSVRYNKRSKNSRCISRANIGAITSTAIAKSVTPNIIFDQGNSCGPPCSTGLSSRA